MSSAAHLSLTGNVVLRRRWISPPARARIRAAESILDEDARNAWTSYTRRWMPVPRRESGSSLSAESQLGARPRR